MKFQDREQFTNDDVEAAIIRDDPGELPFVPLTVAMASDDPAFAQEVCLRLFAHADAQVRGNAVISLGHLARRFRALDEKQVRPAVESALLDADEYVRTVAKSAADEIHQFLHWNIEGHIYG
jgi:hypothetical protein